MTDEAPQQHGATMADARLTLVVAAAFLAAACSGAAQSGDPAQSEGSAQPGGSALQEADDTELVVDPFDLTVGEIEEDADLLNQAGEEVGAIVSVLVQGGRAVAITAEIPGTTGEEREVVIGLDRLQVNPDDDLVTTLSVQELQRLPAWEG
jgi:hypothetical protein